MGWAAHAGMGGAHGRGMIGATIGRLKPGGDRQQEALADIEW
jgi:hypothetical protein